jgi:peptidyl-prolyl cis-trans isomerase SurA
MKFLIFILSLFFSMQIQAAPVPYEYVAAVVDGEMILYSEIVDASYQYRQMPGFSGLSPKELEARVLDKLIDDKIILARSRRDSIQVTDTEVDQRLNQHLQSLAARQSVDMETLAKAVEQQTGQTMAEYRSRLAGQIREQMTLRKVQMRYVGNVQPTRKEVEEFYAEYRDSLPWQYDLLQVAHIQRRVVAAKELQDSVFLLAKSLIDTLDQGVEFAQLAKRHSQEPSAAEGGDIGFYKKGQLDPDYERAAYRLGTGKYTLRPVLSRDGFHIIRKLAERDGEVRTAHIFLALVPTAQDSLKAKQFLDSLKQEVQKSASPAASFATLAAAHSEDDESRLQGGDLGWTERSRLDTSFYQIVADLQKGDLSAPVFINGDWHLFYMKDIAAKRRPTIEDNYEMIEQMAMSILAERKLEKFLKEWRKEVFIDIRKARTGLPEE